MPEALGLSQKLRATNGITEQCSMNECNAEVRLISMVLLKGMLCLQHQSYTTITRLQYFQKAKDSGLMSLDPFRLGTR